MSTTKTNKFTFLTTLGLYNFYDISHIKFYEHHRHVGLIFLARNI